MQNTIRHRREGLRRTSYMARLPALFLTLGVLGLVFVRFRDPNTWSMFAAEDEAGQTAASPHDSQPAKAGTTIAGARGTGFSRNQEAKPPKGGTPTELAPTGPTDQNADEMEDIHDSLSTVYDGNLWTMPAEQPAYFRILGWVDHQPAALLKKRARRDFLYDTLVRAPDTMRLQILEVKLTVLQVIQIMDMDKEEKGGKSKPMLSPEGHPIYEVRGVSREGGTNLYFAAVVDLPPGMPIGPTVHEDARLVGYFFKVQGYYSELQQRDFDAARRKIKPLKAPLIIGRLIWTPQQAATAAESVPVGVTGSILAAALLVALGVIVYVYWNSRRSCRVAVQRIVPGNRVDPDAVSVDDWLEGVQAGGMAEDPAADTTSHSDGSSLDTQLGGRREGNIFGGNGDSNVGDHSGN